MKNEKSTQVITDVFGDKSMPSFGEIEAAKVLHRFFAKEMMLITKFAEIHDKKACIPLWAYNSIKDEAQKSYEKLPSEVQDFYRNWACKILNVRKGEET